LIAALRAEPQLCAEPLAVVQAGLGGRAQLCSERPAPRKGVEAGQTLAEARAICPRLLSREASPERERAAAQAAREAASAVSPRVEEAGPGLVYLDVSGLESLIGDDRAVGAAPWSPPPSASACAPPWVWARASRWPGSPRRAASADLTLEASASGVGGGAFRVVPAEEQREFLAALPLYALELARRAAGTVAALRPVTLGEVAALPPGPLAARLGRRLRCSRGWRGGRTLPRSPRARSLRC